MQHNDIAPADSKGILIKLISNEPGKSLTLPRQRLLRTPYFQALFSSSFADADNVEFRIIDIAGMRYSVETLFFVDYLSLEHGHNLKSPLSITWVIDCKCRPSMREAVLLYRLANYYEIDLLDSVEEYIRYSWLSKSLTTSGLEQIIKAIRALKKEVNEEKSSSIELEIFSRMLGFGHPALRSAHEMSEYEQSRFWPDFVTFCTADDRYAGLVTPYYRLMQSLPTRPSPHQHIMLSALAQALDESHFQAMKLHRESLGHQYGDFALHPPSIIQLLDRRQCLWCWENWSNSEGEKSEETEGYQLLIRRLGQFWPTLLLNGELEVLDDVVRQKLAAEVGQDR